QAEDGIRDFHVTGVQTCALPISPSVLSRTPGAIFLVGSNRFVNPRPSVRTPNPFIIQRYLVSPHQGGLPAPRGQPVTAPPAGPRVSARPRHHGQPVPTPT